jgi:hypothetical protein
VPPFGYYTLNENTNNIKEVLAEVNQLIGMLDKQKAYRKDSNPKQPISSKAIGRIFSAISGNNVKLPAE